MKKSKIIIPAAAILALSVGASVTGTVAWFTASRTATISANNLAAINTAGDLNVTLAAGIGTTVSDKTVSLSYLRDVSYDDVNNKAFVAVLDTKGENVIATRELSSTEKDSYSTVTVNKDSESWNGKTSVNVYYYNSWTATFSTSSTSNAANYLLFDSSRDVSKIGNGTIADDSIYRAVRVGMTCDKYSFVWAPYTSLGADSVAYISKAGDLTQSQPAKKAPVYTNYVSSTGDLYSKYAKAITTTPEPVVREGSLKKDADEHKGLLSTTLKSGVDAVVEFKLWFEGIDPNCINDSKEITSVASNIVKNMSLSFYAIDSTTLAAAGA